MKKKSKLCLIVDNPSRDLDGLALVAWHLAVNGAEVYMVPMYFKEEVFKIAPDLVLLNYIRTANGGFAAQCKKLGILTSVMDTEGGAILNWEKYFGNINKLIEVIDLYCTWGLKQSDYLNSQKSDGNTSIIPTGCPRYDFCINPWRGAQPPISGMEKEIILVNTNFPLAIPRFQSEEKEIETMLSEGYEKEYVLKLVAEYKRALQSVVEAVKHLAEKFPQENFVIRPHPFERKSFYENEFKGISNVETRHEGPVFPWINRCKTLLHFNCSTALEAYFHDKEPIYMGWIDAPMLTQPVSSDLSLHASSLGEMEIMLKDIIEGKRLPVSEPKAKMRKVTIKNFFYSSDGNNSKRVAENIETLIQKRGSSASYGFFGYLYRLVLSTAFRGEIKSSTVNALLLFLGSKKYVNLKKILLGKNPPKKHIEKRFDDAQVRGILERISRVTGNNTALQAEWADSCRESYIGTAGNHSVRISQKG